ncbi:hypothetical protein AB0C29_17850 [Actinoplanes sp. NPDC048791]|uniref:hypothetical protein n=1 Tax=Actinoplanes sp. NPDC048791 TaxID=3154623 RepID=UPI0033E679E2
MRFFSNDARESSDDQAQDDGPERVRSEPVAVPNQRPPSPWSNTPPAADDRTPADSTAADPDRDGVVDQEVDDVTRREDTDPPPFHEPSPQPTAFGASTVGGAVAASAMANPTNDRWDATDRDSAADTGVGDDANVAPGDGVVNSDADRHPGHGTVTAPDTVPATWTAEDTRDGRDRTDPDDVVDVPLDDTSNTGPGAVSARSDDRPDLDGDGNRDDSVTTFDDQAPATSAALKDEGGFDDPKAVDPATETPLESSASDGNTADTTPLKDDAPLKDDGGFDDPKAVDPATGAPIDSTPPAEAAVPVAAAATAAAATTSAGTAEKSGSLFDQDDARTFQERWRDVQLRFVDSPKDAAGDAAKLVDEAVEKLSASLRSQREGLNNDTEDTEQLRVQLRGYRDMLNRILSL